MRVHALMAIPVLLGLALPATARGGDPADSREPSVAVVNDGPPEGQGDVASPLPEAEGVREAASLDRPGGSAPVDTRNVSPWDLHPALEAGLLIGGVTLMSIDVVYKEQNRGPWCKTACDASGINPLDRMVTGWYNPDAALASDILLGVSIGLPVLAQIIDTGVSRPADGWTGFGRDFLVLVETAAVTSGLTSFVKYSVGRVRPYAYNDSLADSKRTEPDAGLSFPSGHTSMAFAMATSWSWLYMKRHPDSPAVVPIWVGSYALATTVAVLRPVAGKHFWTDVIAGAALGVGVGLLVPYLHEIVAKKNRAGRNASIIVSPSVVEGGGGAVVTVIK